MSYFAVALWREGSDWDAEEIELEEVEDLDGLVDVARTAAGDDADVVLLAVEEDDEWLGLLRAEGDEPRLFLSDTRMLSTSTVAGLFADGLEPAADAEDDEHEESDEDEDEEVAEPVLDAVPGGDAAVVSDLGTRASALLSLCAKEGVLPGDVIVAVCENAGCLEAYESVRGV